MESVVQDQKISPPIYLLMLLMSFASLIAVLITPALLSISNAFHIEQSQSTWLVTAFLLGYAIGQLPYGPLANRYGRKNTALMGLMVAFLGSLIQLFAIEENSFTLLVIARAVMAFGGACGPVIVLAILSDCYDEQNARKHLSTLYLVFALMPCAAIAIGGYLTIHFGWQSTFYIANIYLVIILFAIYTQLHETLPKRQFKPMQLSGSLKGIIQPLQNPKYLSFCLLSMAGVATSYIFNSLSPFLSINILHISSQHYGLLSIIPSAGLLIGSYLSNKASMKFCGRSVLLFGILILLISSTVFFALFYIKSISIYSLYIPSFFLFMGVALILPNSTTLAIACVEDKATGAGVMNASNLLLTGLGVFISSYFAKGSVMALPVSILLIAAMCLLIIISIKK